MAGERRMSSTLMHHPPMDYTCARAALLDSQPVLERLNHHQLEQHQLLELGHPDLNQDSHYYHYQHRHLLHHLHYQHHPQHQHPHHTSATGGYRDGSDEFIAVELNSVSFDVHSHYEKEKHGVLQNQCIDQYHSTSAHKPCEDALISAKPHEDTRLSHRTCEDAPFSPTRHEIVQLACEGIPHYHQLHSSVASGQPRIKLLCSIGGRIMVRPVDGKLRYCGGETRIIAVDRGLSFSELMEKMTHIYGSPLSLKYQLPGEDLDALVSVFSDDDLQNMLEEYDKLVASNGTSWLRLFLFTSSLQSEILLQCDVGHGREDCCAGAMQHYIGAINGVPELVSDGHINNDVLSHQSHQRMPFDIPGTTPAVTCLSKPPLCLSAPSSTPSSPSVASRQAHYKLCGNLDTCPQFDVSTPEAGQGIYIDASSALKCEYQGHAPVESPGIQHDTLFSRAEAVHLKENVIHSGDPQEILLQRHRGTGTFLADVRHDMQKSHGPANSPCEAHCGNQPAAQPLSMLAHQAQMEDDFSRVEPVQHCQSEGHKQLPVLFHQGLSPLHREGPARLQRGLSYELSCQNIDGQGLLPFSQEFIHPHAHSAHVVSTIPTYTMGSAPSSPQDSFHGRCSCYWQHCQVHRGISVSLGENSHSKRPNHIGEQYIRKHGSPLLSRFCDSSSLCTDPSAWHCLPNLGKGFELDEQDQVIRLRKHIFDRSQSRCHLVDCHAKESAAYHADSHALMEPLHGLYERSMHCHGHVEYHDQKGQHAEKARGFPVSSEFQLQLGEHATHLRTNELESAKVLTAGNMTHIMPPQDYKGDTNKEYCIGQYNNHGQGAVETGTLGVRDGGGALMLKSSHISPGSSRLGYKESDCDLNSASFSSTDAVAGSLSRPSLEAPVWVVSPCLAANDEITKEREVCTLIPAVDSVANSMHPIDGTCSCEDISLGALTVNTSKNPIFSCIESNARVRSKTSPHVEHLTSAAVNHVPEHSVEKGSASYIHESRSDIDHLGSLGPSQPFPSRALDPVIIEGTTISLSSPTYDRSPISSIDNATFSFAKGEEGPIVNAIIGEKEVTSQICAIEQCMTSSIKKSHLNDVQQYKGGKGEVDTARQQVIFEQELKPMSEESRSLLHTLSKQHSAEEGAHASEQGSKPVPMVQNISTSDLVQEEQVGGLVNLCNKEDEKELPAKQAEAEAIARGLQIIRNDDLEDLKELGSGTYGTVFHGKWRGSDVAIKRIKASCFMGHPSVQERLVSEFWKEAGTLSQLHHPNVVAFYGVVPDGPEGTLATVAEYMVNGSLRQVLAKKDRTIDRKKRLLIAMDAAFGMEYLHSKKIVHFDLKSENLLVNMRDAHRPICKVGDFGLSKVKHRTLVSGGVRGTLPWMAPELLNENSLVTEKVDVYSFGIVMWELLTGEEPYANMHYGTIIGGIVNNNLRPAIPSWCDPSWRDLMERCWSGNPAERPDFSVVTSELRAIAVSMNIK